MAICETQMNPSDEQIARGERNAVCIHSRNQAAPSRKLDESALVQLARPLRADAGAATPHPLTLTLRPSTSADYGKP